MFGHDRETVGAKIDSSGQKLCRHSHGRSIDQMDNAERGANSVGRDRKRARVERVRARVEGWELCAQE